MFKTILSKLRRVILVIAKVVAAMVLAIVTLVATTLAFFFATPEFEIGTETIRTIVQRYAPANVGLEFGRFQIGIERLDGLFFAKRISIKADDFCVSYEGKAVRACFATIRLGVSFGWGGERLVGESKVMPHLIEIEPIRLLRGNVAVDTTAFPEEEEKPREEGGFDALSFLRKEILPKWRMEGSRVEVDSFRLSMEKGTGYEGRFRLTSREEGETLRALVSEFRSLDGKLDGDVDLRLFQIAGSEHRGITPRDRWRIETEGRVAMRSAPAGRASVVRLKGDANITSARAFEFRLQTLFEGITGIREARLAGETREDRFDGKFSLKAGGRRDVVRALNFVNCRVRADLANKTGSLRCGPQMVDLRVREAALVRRPALYRLAPEFELFVDRVDFGERKSADLRLAVELKHLGLIDARTSLEGSIREAQGGEWLYSIKGTLDAMLPKFAGLVRLLRGSIASVPAPLNALDGQIGLSGQIDLTEAGGEVRYQVATRLDSSDSSDAQSVHLDFNGETSLSNGKEGLEPSTRANLFIRTLSLMAPRFDLRRPPRFSPDSRFKTSAQMKREREKQVAKAKAEPMDFRIRIKTVTPEAIRITTNLTKGPIPVSLDVVFDAGSSANSDSRVKQRLARQSSNGNSRGPASVIGQGTTLSPIETETIRSADGLASQPNDGGADGGVSPIRGWVRVGRTPIELFRRVAVVESIRVDFPREGPRKLDGKISFAATDYNIVARLIGSVEEPKVILESDPPLEQNQILSVLVFGRPMEDLDDDQRGSVRSLDTALANAFLGVSSLYLLASTPIESIGYDPERGMITARVGLGGGATLEVGGSGGQSEIGFRKRLSRNLVLRSDVETLSTTGERTVSALVEWVKRF